MKTKRNSRLFRLIAFILILCMGLSFLAACGKDDDSDDPQTPPEDPKPIVEPDPEKKDPEPEKKDDPEPEDERDLAQMISDLLSDYEDSGLSLSITGLSLRMANGESFVEITDGASESLLSVLSGGKLAGDGNFTANVAKSNDASEDAEMLMTLRDGVIAFSDGENAGYIELEKLIDDLAAFIDENKDAISFPEKDEGSDVEFDLAGISDWLISDLLPLFGEVYSDPDSDYPLLFSQAISSFVDFSLTNTDIGVNYGKLYLMNEKLAKETGKGFINFLCGNGSYDVIMKDYEAALSVNPKNLLQYLDMKGFTEESVISAVENFKKLQGDEDFDLKAYLSEQSKQYDTVAEMFGVKDDASELKNALETKSMYAILLENFPEITENLPDLCNDITPREEPLVTDGLAEDVAELAEIVEAMICKAEEIVPVCSLSLDPLAFTLSVHGLSLSAENYEFSISFDSSLTTLGEKPDLPADSATLIGEAKATASVKAGDVLTAEGKTVTIGGEPAKTVTVTDGLDSTVIDLAEVSMSIRFGNLLAIVSHDGVYLFEVEEA